LISGWEMVFILVVIAALVIWGPKKIPEIARAIGEAKGEFEKASREATLPPVVEKKAEPTSDDVLIETAKKLGISTEGKTKEQLSREILEKFKAEKESSS
jgi:sec-independent protein translocase protein TatA